MFVNQPSFAETFRCKIIKGIHSNPATCQGQPMYMYVYSWHCHQPEVFHEVSLTFLPLHVPSLCSAKSHYPLPGQHVQWDGINALWKCTIHASHSMFENCTILKLRYDNSRHVYTKYTEMPHTCIATPLGRNFSISTVVVRSCNKCSISTTMKNGSEVVLMKNIAHSIFHEKFFTEGFPKSGHICWMSSMSRK